LPNVVLLWQDLKQTFLILIEHLYHTLEQSPARNIVVRFSTLGHDTLDICNPPNVSVDLLMSFVHCNAK